MRTKPSVPGVHGAAELTKILFRPHRGERLTHPEDAVKRTFPTIFGRNTGQPTMALSPSLKPSPKLATTARLGLAAAACALLLCACGGGGGGGSTSTTPPSTAVTQPTVQDMSANTSAVPSATSDALTTSVLATQALVAGSSASATYVCPGGGTATYTAGASNAAWNGLLNAGDTFSVVYASCANLYGSATLDGTFNVDVTNATSTSTSTELVLSTSTDNLVVTVAQGTVTINGASTLDVTTTTSGATTTRTTVWQSAGITAVTQFGTRSSTWTLSNVDVTRTVVFDSGTLASTSESGTATLTVTHAAGSWSVTVSSTGGVQFDANGVPVSGSWTVVFPNNTLYISVANGVVTVGVDWGNNGTIDATYSFGSTDLANSAG
jgi:hypothetical protein